MSENMNASQNTNSRKRNDTVYIYGLDEKYNLVHYFFILKDALIGGRGGITAQIKSTAQYLKEAYPSVSYIYQVDNSRDIYKAFKELKEESKLENHVHFKMMLEQYGFRIQL